MQKMLLFLFVILGTTSITLAQSKSLENLLIEKELNPSIYIEAKNSAISKGLPVSIKLPEGILIDVLKEENGVLLYSVIKNLLNPLSDSEVLTYNQLTERFNLENAIINYGTSSERNNERDGVAASKFLLIPDWTNDNVISFDPVTGDLLDSNFVLPSPGILASPKHALLNPGGYITVSDQIEDLVQKFDSNGTYLGILAPAGGVNTAILDNLRGHNYRPNGNLVVCVGSGGNSNAIPEFDASGNYLGNFISAGSGGLNSPFCITFRDNDVLVSGSSSDAVHRYDLNGTYLNNLITGVNFPQQVVELSNGNIAVAVFSSPSGLGIYDSNGTQLNFFTSVTSLRGVYQLPNGNFLVTNSSGLHELDGSGNFVRTIFTSSNLQYISLIDYSVIPVELTSFTAKLIDRNVQLNWSTATETNNSGFYIERSEDNLNFTTIGFEQGAGTTTEPRQYSFIDKAEISGTLYYRLKQVDYDGSFSYSRTVEVNNALPLEFSLSQNYPNPFNPTTNISFQVPVNSHLTLKVYDILGNEVATLIDEFKSAGNHEVVFDSHNLSSGVYFYNLKAAGVNGETYSSTMKMTVMK